VPAVVVRFVRWLFKWNCRAAPPAAAAPGATSLAAADLAEKVGDRWNRDPRFSDLDRPSPIPVPWRLTTREGAMQSADLVGVESFDGSSGQVEELVTQFKALPRPRLVVLGGAGAGKSTLALQLLRELRFRGFRITVDAADVHRSARKHGSPTGTRSMRRDGSWSPTRCRTRVRAGRAVSCGWGRIGRATCWRSWCCCSTTGTSSSSMRCG
jgi:hypothetical protein